MDAKASRRKVTIPVITIATILAIVITVVVLYFRSGEIPAEPSPATPTVTPTQSPAAYSFLPAPLQLNLPQVLAVSV